MTQSNHVNTKTRKPRSKVTGELVGVRLQPELMEKVDGWRSIQRPIPTRPEAIRHYLEIGIKGEPILEEFLKFLLVLKSKPEYDGSLNKQIEDIYAALQKTAIE